MAPTSSTCTDEELTTQCGMPRAPDLRIQIVSDLHIEFYHESKNLNFLIEPEAPILALLGDIGNAGSRQLKTFLYSQCDRFEKVLFLAGNHEYYNNGTNMYSMTEQLEWMRKVCSKHPNLHFMEKESMVLNDVVVLGTTLWSNISKTDSQLAENFLNDYRLSYNHAPGEYPRNLKAEETTAIYLKSISWIESQLETAKENAQKVVVLTHHTPMLIGTSHPSFKDSSVTCCFSSDLEALLLSSGPTLVAWACGHTHYNFDFMVGKVRVVSNQRGYKNRDKDDYQKDGVVLEVYAE